MLSGSSTREPAQTPAANAASPQAPCPPLPPSPAAGASSRPLSSDPRRAPTATSLGPPQREHALRTRQELAPFVIIGDTPAGELAVPAASARAAAQAARHLSEYCPHTRATWQVNPHAGSARVVVLGCARPPTSEQMVEQDAHAFLLAPVEALPPVWVALCSLQIGSAEFEALDNGMGRPCRSCHQRWAASHRQHTGLPIRSPGEHLYPLLRRPPLADSPRGDPSSWHWVTPPATYLAHRGADHPATPGIATVPQWLHTLPAAPAPCAVIST